MSSNRYASDLFRMTQLLSQRVSKEDPFFKEIALMDIDSRKKLALLYVLIEEVKIFDIDIMKMTEEELIKKIVYPVIKRFGQAQFRADPLTHLGFKLGITSDTWSFQE